MELRGKGVVASTWIKDLSGVNKVMPRTIDRKVPDEQVFIRDFPGIVTNADPNDLTPGAARIQINLQATLIGELRVRGGYRAVKFED